MATGKGGRYRYYKCNTRIGKGIDYCKSDNLPMQKLDAMVLNSLADRVFTAGRVRLMLESLLKTKATVPAHILQEKHIDTFTRYLRTQ